MRHRRRICAASRWCSDPRDERIGPASRRRTDPAARYDTTTENSRLAGTLRLFRTTSQWVAVAVCAILGVALFAFVDLTPAVEGDFFFSTDDPQLQGTKLVEQQFGSAPQIFIAAHSDRVFSRPYLQRIRRLTDDLSRVDGVIDVRSLTRGPEDLEDIGESPFWSRLLLAPDRSA